MILHRTNREREKQGQDGKVWFYRDDYVRDKKQAYQDGIDNVLNNPQKYGLEKREIKEHDVCDTCDEKASCINPCPMKLIEEENPKIICWSEEDQEMLNQVIEDIVKLAGSYVCYHKDVDWLKSLKDRVQPQPRQEWSKEDEHRINDTIYFLETAKKHYVSTVELDACIDWLKPLKYRVQPQPKWSEEDDGMYNRIVSFIPQHLTAESYTACINWLKSLRPQSLWKPSDMELEVLRLAAEKDGTCLMGLYEQLKKLREE